MQEGQGIYTVELYLRVRLAVSEGMSRRQAAKHFNISRDSVAKMVGLFDTARLSAVFTGSAAEAGCVRFGRSTIGSMKT